MNWTALSLVVSLICTAALAQQAGTPKEGERAARPDSASNARVGGWCDALTGEKKEQCLREESRKQPDRAAKGSGLSGTCHALIAAEKERCLREGATVDVHAKPSAGASAGGASVNH